MTGNLEKDLENRIEADMESFLKRCCRNALQSAEPALAVMLEAELAKRGVNRVSNTERGIEEWQGIESLSRLRRVAGGRLENIKKKWIEAGLPVKADPGMKNDGGVLNEAGWIVLSNWVSGRGFEVRRTADSKYFFEVRRKC